MDICFEGIGQMVATFATEEKLTPGMAVTLKKSGTVGLGNGDDAVCGVTVGAHRNGAVAVQIGGVVKVGYSDGSDPEVGCTMLACNGEGKVAVSEKDGAGCLVLAVDKNEKTVVIKL